MKLDLIYEFQPKVKPWDKPFPYGQREAEQRTYDEAIAEIQYADRLGFNTAWVVEHHFREGRSACPCNEAVLGGLALSTKQIRLGFGVTLTPFGFGHPARLAEKVATVDVLSHGRVDWGTGRSTPMEQTAFGVPTDDRSREQSREAIEIVVKMWENERLGWDSENLKFPERFQTPKPYQDPHPPVWQAAASQSSAVQCGEQGLGLLSLSIFQPVDKVAETIAMYRAAAASAKPENQLTRVKNNKVAVYTLVHVYDDADEAADYGLWDSVTWWYRNLAEFQLKWELAHLADEAKEKAFPALEAIRRGDVPDLALPGPGHDHRRDGGGVPPQDRAVRGSRGGPVALLRPVRRPAARQGDANPGAAQQRHHAHPRRAGPSADRHCERLRGTT